MKKFLVSLLLLLPLYCFAQKGEQGIGINMGFETCVNMDCKIIPLSVKYHYNLTDRVRIVPHIGYIVADEIECINTNVYEGGVSVHYFLNGVKRFRPYLVGGISVGGYNSMVYDDLMLNGESYSPGSKYNGFLYGVGFGGGLDCRIRDKLSLHVELLAHLSSLQDRLCFGPNIGVTYTF